MGIDFQHISYLSFKARNGLSNLKSIAAEKVRLESQVNELTEKLKQEQILTALSEVPIDRLRDVPEIRVPIEALRRAGISTLADLYSRSVQNIAAINGVSQSTAYELRQVATKMADAVSATIQARIDFNSDRPETLQIMNNLESIKTLNEFDRDTSGRAAELSQVFAENIPLLTPMSGRVKWFFTSSSNKAKAIEASTKIEEAITSISTGAVLERASNVVKELGKPSPGLALVKAKYEQNASDYLAIFDSLTQSSSDVGSEYEQFNQELIEKIKSREFDANLLNATLRKYQIFGIQFALVQKRVIIGDEMGLGKTMQALGVLTQVHKEGGSRYLIVCPASVIINWEREIQNRTRMTSIRIHGSEQEAALKSWLEQGGVALTTFDTLKNFGLDQQTLGSLELDLFVVDEAHFAKNLNTGRSRELYKWTLGRPRVVFLTGTPMENRVSEFMGLASVINGDLANTLDHAVLAAGPEPFKKAVAPIYLRRNVKQVLGELPDVVETEEHCTWDGVDQTSYLGFVQRGNFMGMRRAAFIPEVGKQTSKMERLLELIDDAHANNQKVIVFSFFTSVIQNISRQLGDLALEPITGSVSPKRRQEIVDQFTNSVEPRVLVGQIQAAGTGLNIQSASVVILCEPQIKPTLETQAIARAHRMGQVRTVNVHRLIIPDSVDTQMINMLHQKTVEFDAYARDSHLAELSGELRDEEIKIETRKVAAQIVEAERKRLGLDTSGALELDDHSETF